MDIIFCKKQQKRNTPDTSGAVTNEKEQQSEGGDEVMGEETDWENVQVPEDADEQLDQAGGNDAGEENPAANGGGAASQKRQKKDNK